MKAQTARDQGITSKDAGKDACRDGRITGKDVGRDASRDGESTITYLRVREFFQSQEFSHTPTHTHILYVIVRKIIDYDMSSNLPRHEGMQLY
jgi:hypothetical protein